MKRITILLFVFFLPVILFFLSCKTDHYKYTGIKLLAVKEKSANSYEEVKDDIIETLTFQVEAITKHVSSSKLLKNFTQPLYAAFDPDDPIFDNQIIYENTQLLLDKDIYYEGELIEKGTDLMAHPSLKDHTWLKHLPAHKFVIGFDAEFYTNVSISEGEYTITVICHTDDELKLESSITKQIRLNE